MFWLWTPRLFSDYEPVTVAWIQQRQSYVCDNRLSYPYRRQFSMQLAYIHGVRLVELLKADWESNFGWPKSIVFTTLNTSYFNVATYMMSPWDGLKFLYETRRTEICDCCRINTVLRNCVVTQWHSPTVSYVRCFNPLITERKLLYLNTQFVLRSKHFSSRL